MTNYKHTASLLFACLLSLLGTACASTDGDDTASARECRGVASLGSKMKRSVCMSPEEWAAIDAAAAEESTAQSDFFRRARESGSLGAGPEFDSPTATP